jgi:hypothetical protein
VVIIAVSVVAAFVASTVPWLLVLGRRFGHLLTGATVLAGEGVVLFAALVVSRWFHGDVVVVVLAVELAMAAAGFVALRWRGGARPSRSALATWLPALTGGALWTIAVSVAPLVRDGAQLAWALSGDGSNNLYHARAIRDDGGIAVGPGVNAVPLPATLIAISGLPIDVAGTTPEAFRQQLVALTIAWVIALSAWCLLSGVVTAALVPRERVAITATASALGSLLPLAAFTGGLPMQWGYLNVNLAVPLALLVWCAALGSRRHPVAAVTTLFLITILTLATWSLLVTIPLVAAGMIVLRDRRWLRAVRGMARWPLIVGAVLLFAWGATVAVPALQSQRSTFAIEGHGFPLTWPVLIAVGTVFALLAVAAGARIGRDVGVTSLALGAGAICALGGVIALSALQLGDPFTSYYSVKLAWLLAVIFGTLAVGLCVALLSRAPRFALAATSLAVVTVFLVAEYATPNTVRTGSDPRPFAMVLGGGTWHTGDDAVDQIVRLSNDQSPGILWGSGHPDEGLIDFWALANQGGQLDLDAGVRAVAFRAYRAQRDGDGFRGEDDDTLCGLLELQPQLTVYTADAGLRDRLLASCPSVVGPAIVQFEKD